MGALTRSHRGRALACAALASALLPAASPAREAPRAFTDLEITLAIERGLMSQAVLLFHDLDVRTADGVVTLRGKVDSLLDAERAVEVAAATRGVRSIVDRIQVVPVPRSDPDLAREVKAAIERDPALEASQIAVEVEGGRATLSGVVDSWQQKQFAAQAAKRVPGLSGVREALGIDYGQARTDAEIREDAERRLAWDVRVDAGLIEVEVEDGLVILRGFVGSDAERKQAYWDAWVTGAKAVDASGLEVRWWARDRMRQRGARLRADPEVARSIRDALRYDPRVSRADLSVSVEEGTATLSGTVRSLLARLAAEEDARNTFGTVRVRNHLKVRNGAPPGDRELARAVEEALAADRYESRHAISVSASRGRVTLEGRVDSAFDARRAEAVAGGVEGVKAVTSGIEVAGRRLSSSDREIQAEIRDALFWDARVDEAHIEVRVEDGVATLTGWVDDWSERERAEGNALHAGAARVRNRLHVELGRN